MRPSVRTARHLIVAGVVAATVATALGGCSTFSGGSSPGSGDSPSGAVRTADPDNRADSELRTEVITDGLAAPWGVVPLAENRALVSERDTGRILLVDGAGRTELTTLPGVVHRSEDGLLGLVLTPDQKNLLAYFTTAEDNRIVSMRWDGSRLGEPRVILSGLRAGPTHDGGRMIFGPDGYLYVGTGDARRSDLAQDQTSLNGKVLRLTAAGRPAPGNPFGNEVFSYGHRNVQGLTFDDQGRLWAAEFGENTWDEVNLITGGGNYGWPEAEGADDDAGFVNPVVVFDTGDASPSALTFWRGSLWLAALRGDRLWQIPLADGQAQQPVSHLTSTYGRLRTVIPSPDGSSLWLTTSATDGRGRPGQADDRLLRLTAS